MNFKCPECQKGFEYWHSYESHARVLHGAEPRTEAVERVYGHHCPEYLGATIEEKSA